MNGRKIGEVEAMKVAYNVLSDLPEDAQERVLVWLRARLKSDYAAKSTSNLTNPADTEQ